MSSRYTLFQIEQLRERFQIENSLPASLKKRYNIAPGQTAPVIVEHNRKQRLEMMKWGFIPLSAKDTNSIFRYKTFNAKSENVFDKATWKDAIRSRRCLVPSNGFYEWRTTATGKQPFFIRPKDQGVFSFAGIYSSWQDPEGIEWGTFSIITTTPNKEMRTIHDRMPIILHPNDEAIWLDPSISDAGILYDFMRSYPNDMLLINEVSQEVNTIKVDNARLMTRISTK